MVERSASGRMALSDAAPWVGIGEFDSRLEGTAATGSSAAGPALTISPIAGLSRSLPHSRQKRSASFGRFEPQLPQYFASPAITPPSPAQAVSTSPNGCPGHWRGIKRATQYPSVLLGG